MDDIHIIINKVQMKKKIATFIASVEDAPTIENTIKDVGLLYDKLERKTQVTFTIYPNNEDYDEDSMIHLDVLDDEIPAIGQIFG